MIEYVICIPGKKLGDGFRREDLRAITVGNSFNIRLKLVITNNRDFGLESVTVRGTIKMKGT